MKKCVSCKSRYRKGTKTSFHGFPTNLTERSIWLKNMKASNWTPKGNDRLCSKHFENDCLIIHAIRTSLKSGSVPTIFEDPNSFEVLVIGDCGNVSGGKETDVDIQEETIPNESIYPYEYASSTSPTSACSLSKCQSPKQGGAKRLLSESILEDNGFQKDASTTTDDLERDRLLQDSIRNDHFYGVSRSPEKSRFENSIAHDHRYQKSPRSSKKALQRTKILLKLSKARVTALTRRVKSLKNKVANLIR